MADNGAARRRAGRWWLWICAGIAAAGAVAAALGIWHLPDRMYPGSGAEVVQAQAALQGGLLTAAAALTAVAGGLIALDETRQANTETRRANAAADGREREANANTHVRELYIAAIGLLSADTVDGRLGGIYALERVARDSADDQRTVVEVLSAFVREHTKPPAPTPPTPRPPPGRRWTRTTGVSGPPLPQPTTDVQAALTVLGRLPYRHRIPRADLSGAQLTGADLRGADLTSAKLFEANLASAELSRAILTRAELYKATLTDAELSGANLTRAWLNGANLSGAELVEVNLSGAELGGATLTDAWGLTAEQVAVAVGNAQTRLPDGVARPESWPPSDPSPGPPGGGS